MKATGFLVPVILLVLFQFHPLMAGLPVTGGVDVQQDWYTTESEHFRICFPLHLRSIAEIIKDDAEWVFDEFSSWAGYTSEDRIDIVITDNSDLANGFVRPGSKGHYITLYTVYPYQDFIDGGDAFKNWYRNILIHEFAHIVHQEQVGGFSRFVNSIFGRLLYPNATLPRFYREGFATYAETVREFGYGRGNYPYTDMYVRAAIEEGNPPLLDRVSSRNGVWPAGTGPYLFGVSFVDYLSLTSGEKTLFTYNEATSKKVLFKGSLAFIEVYKKPLSEAWGDWLEHEKKQLPEQVGGETTALSTVSGEYGWVYSLALNDAGDRAVYSIRPTDALGGLYLYDFTQEKEQLIKRGLYAENLQFSHDGSKAYYIRGELNKNVYYENNVYELDLKKRQERQVTKSGHVQGFVLADSGRELLIMYSTPFRTEIHLLDRDTGKKTVILPMTAQKSLPIIEQPAISPDGSLVAVSCKDSEGNRSIYTVPLASLRSGEAYLLKITPDGQNAYAPEWLNENKLLWVGDGDGTYNIYCTDITDGSLKRVTAVRTGVFDPVARPDGALLLREYTSKGFRVSLCIPNDRNSQLSGGTKISGPSDESSYAPGVLLTALEERPVENPEKQKRYNKALEPYDPSRWLLPAYWSPLYLDDRIALGLGFYTSARDLIQRHAYRTGILFDLFDTRIKTFFDYTYYSYPFNYFFSLFASQRTDNGVFSPDFALFPGISFPLLKRDFSLKFDLGVIVEHPYLGIDLSFLYSDIKAPARWIGPERGIVFEQGIYYNLPPDNFLILSDYFSWYIRIFDPFLLNFNIASRWDLNGTDERVMVGSYREYVFAPMNGVYTRGYSDPIPARFAMNLTATISIPLITVERGIGALPFFFEGANLSFFIDSGIAVSQAETPDFLIGSFQEVLDDPGRHILSSIGPKLEFDFIIGYDYPLTVEIGYVYPLSRGGSRGLFFEARVDLLL
jgi:sugar lactone lactonase YvrE